MNYLDEETLKALLLKSIKDDWTDILNLMHKREISWLSIGEICELWLHILGGKARIGKIYEILYY